MRFHSGVLGFGDGAKSRGRDYVASCVRGCARTSLFFVLLSYGRLPFVACICDMNRISFSVRVQILYPDHRIVAMPLLSFVSPRHQTTRRKLVVLGVASQKTQFQETVRFLFSHRL